MSHHVEGRAGDYWSLAEGAGEPRPGDSVPRAAWGRAESPPALERERIRSEAVRLMRERDDKGSCIDNVGPALQFELTT